MTLTSALEAPGLDRPSSRRNRPRTPWRRSDAPAAALFLLPAVVGFLVFYLWPLINGVRISFTDWNLLSPAKNVGVDNYIAMVNDPKFWNALRVTLEYVVINISTQIVLALAIATLMQRLVAWSSRSSSRS